MSSRTSPAPSDASPHHVAPQPRVGGRAALLRDTIRSHRTGMLVWMLAGGLTMLGMAVALATEMDDFPGGAAGLAASVSAGAEAMRPLRWPAERLETLGGYLTYHNVILFNLFLAVYGAIQGARDIRGAEERGSLEEILATGHPRAAVVRDRAAGFAIVAALIGLGLGLGVAAGLLAGGEPNLGGSLITMGTSGLVALVGYALGMLLSQLVGSVRAAGGIASALLCLLYVATNVEDKYGPAAGLGLISPFHWANQSRALVPGQSLDARATMVLLVLAMALFVGSVWAFNRRDYAAALWTRRARAAQPVRLAPTRAPARPPTRVGHVPHRMLGSVAAAGVRRGWVGMAAWAACMGTFAALFVALQPAVLDVWDQFSFINAMTGAMGSTSIQQAYWAYTGEFLTPVIAAYIITQASGWVADLHQGRVELVLSTPVSWTMLVRGRLATSCVGAAVIAAAALAVLGIGSGLLGSPVDPAGTARLLVVTVLFAAAFAALAALVVAVLPRPVAVTVLAVVVAGSYLLAFFVPIFGWPEWLDRASVFWAFGHPYLAWPATTQWFVLLVLALAGGWGAGALAERRPKVP